jgi:hypothetical protein
MMMKTPLTLFATSLVLLFAANNAYGQCASDANIYTFVHNSNAYEVVRENRSWVDAAACAVERGGKLAEINDMQEQDALFSELNANASIVVNDTVAPDGGGASYAWIGGNDLASEGVWIWDGINAGTGPQFWQGMFDGSVVGGLFNNWGNEPDNFGSGQDGLAIALTDWPLGVAGQWNDVAETNTLFYVIEYDSDPPGFTINSGLNDAWVSADAAFQGLFFTVFEDLGLFFLSWFTFDSVPPGQAAAAVFGAADQRWVTGLGSYSGNSVTLNVELTSGGIFNSSVPLATQSPGYGTITVIFISCNKAVLIYDFPSVGLSGEMTLTRVVTDNVALCEALAEG